MVTDKNIEVGFVLGTKDTSPFNFFVAIKEEHYLQLDDLILIEEKINEEVIRFYGVVIDVRKSFEGLNFNSENFLVILGKLPTKISHVAEISVLRVEPEKYIAPTPGNPVLKIQEQSFVTVGYYFDKMETKIAAGFFKNNMPAYLNYDFLNGKKGAHLSVSGISGVATKTSYSAFLLYSIFQHPEVDKNQVKALIFNVKGEDLLFLDKPNIKMRQDKNLLSKYKELGLSGTPFQNVGFYTSGRLLHDKSLEASTASRKDLNIYSWTLKEIIDNNLFTYFFSESEDTNLGFIIRQAGAYLYESMKKGDFPLDSIARLDDVLRLFGLEEIQSKAFKNQAKVSIEAFLRRLAKISYQSKNLISVDLKTSKKNRIAWENHQLSVVDIHNLSSSAQMFVVSTVIKDIFEAKEKTGSRYPLVFIMLDELNKYAPRNGTSPIKDILVDIAERGRSLGIILIGAQQTASEIEKRVYANSAIKAAGRLDSGESQSPEYHYLTTLMKKRAMILPQGEMIFYQPDVPYPLIIHFPFPSWATRKEEVDELNRDLKKDRDVLKGILGDFGNQNLV